MIRSVSVDEKSFRILWIAFHNAPRGGDRRNFEDLRADAALLTVLQGISRDEGNQRLLCDPAEVQVLHVSQAQHARLLKCVEETVWHPGVSIDVVAAHDLMTAAPQE